jgi:purine-binding chemotaxis protein CheW
MARRLVFTLAGERMALPAASVREVVALPKLTRVPHAPAALLGLGNIRGTVMPVVSASGLLGRAETAALVVVLDRAEPVGLAVSDVPRLAEGDDAASRLLEIDALLANAFRGGTAGGGRRVSLAVSAAVETGAVAETIGLLGFTIAGQAFALPLQQIEALLALPEDITLLPGADEVALGAVAHRGTLLPLLDLRVLLHLPRAPAAKPRIVVTRIKGAAVGLRVDAVDAVLHAAEAEIDAVPAVLTRGHAEAKIQAILRRDGGRLVSLLASDHLVKESVMDRMRADTAGPSATEERCVEAIEQFLIFTLGDETFGMPVGAVREVAVMPERLTRLPKAPGFVEGVMNLRGDAIPVIDQRRRFGVAGAASGQRRLIIAAVSDLVAAFAVDAVTQVLRVPVSRLRAAPELGEGARVFDRITSLEDGARMVLVIEPKELLDRAERDLLAGFQARQIT